MKDKLVKTLPLLILVVALAINLFTVLTSTKIFVQKHFWATGLVAIASIFWFLKNEWSFFLTGFALLLGTFNLVAFTNTITRQELGFSINSFSVELVFQPFSLLVFVIWLAVFLKFFGKKAADWLGI